MTNTEPLLGKFYSTKKFGPISTTHRQWDHHGHCRFLHGYARYVQLVFTCDTLDKNGMCIDFGSLSHIKAWLNEQWDHRCLLSHNDPLLKDFMELEKKGGINLNILPKGYEPTIELSCKYIYDHINPIILKDSNNRCRISSVEVWEHDINSAKMILEP